MENITAPLKRTQRGQWKSGMTRRRERGHRYDEPCESTRSSFADVEDFADFGDDGAGIVFDFDDELELEFFLRL